MVGGAEGLVAVTAKERLREHFRGWGCRLGIHRPEVYRGVSFCRRCWRIKEPSGAFSDRRVTFCMMLDRSIDAATSDALEALSESLYSEHPVSRRLRRRRDQA